MNKNLYRIVSAFMLPVLIVTLMSENVVFAKEAKKEETQEKEAVAEEEAGGADAVESALQEAEGEVAAVSAEGKEVINVRTAEELLAVAEKCDTDVWSADKLIELQICGRLFPLYRTDGHRPESDDIGLDRGGK